MNPSPASGRGIPVIVLPSCNHARVMNATRHPSSGSTGNDKLCSVTRGHVWHALLRIERELRAASHICRAILTSQQSRTPTPESRNA